MSHIQQSLVLILKLLKQYGTNPQAIKAILMMVVETTVKYRPGANHRLIVLIEWFYRVIGSDRLIDWLFRVIGSDRSIDWFYRVNGSDIMIHWFYRVIGPNKSIDCLYRYIGSDRMVYG